MAWDYLRWYHGTASDPKWRAIARRSGQPIVAVVAVWAMILERASANRTQTNASERSGTIANWNDEDAACALDIEADSVAKIRAAMQGKVLDGDMVINWENRQPKREDNSAERARLWRQERKRTQANAKEHILEETRLDSKRVEGALPSAAPARQDQPSTKTQPDAVKSGLGNGAHSTETREARGKRLDVHALPEEWAAWCRKHRPDLNPTLTFVRFHDYWIAQAGAKGRKADWPATWRNWVRNEKGPNGAAKTQPDYSKW